MRTESSEMVGGGVDESTTPNVHARSVHTLPHFAASCVLSAQRALPENSDASGRARAHSRPRSIQKVEVLLQIGDGEVCDCWPNLKIADHVMRGPGGHANRTSGAWKVYTAPGTHCHVLHVRLQRTCQKGFCRPGGQDACVRG